MNVELRNKLELPGLDYRTMTFVMQHVTQLCFSGSLHSRRLWTQNISSMQHFRDQAIQSN